MAKLQSEQVVDNEIVSGTTEEPAFAVLTTDQIPDIEVSTMEDRVQPGEEVSSALEDIDVEKLLKSIEVQGEIETLEATIDQEFERVQLLKENARELADLNEPYLASEIQTSAETMEAALLETKQTLGLLDQQTPRELDQSKLKLDKNLETLLKESKELKSTTAAAQKFMITELADEYNLDQSDLQQLFREKSIEDIKETLINHGVSADDTSRAVLLCSSDSILESLVKPIQEKWEESIYNRIIEKIKSLQPDSDSVEHEEAFGVGRSLKAGAGIEFKGTVKSKAEKKVDPETGEEKYVVTISGKATGKGSAGLGAKGMASVEAGVNATGEAEIQYEFDSAEEAAEFMSKVHSGQIPDAKELGGEMVSVELSGELGLEIAAELGLDDVIGAEISAQLKMGASVRFTQDPPSLTISGTGSGEVSGAAFAGEFSIDGNVQAEVEYEIEIPLKEGTTLEKLLVDPKACAVTTDKKDLKTKATWTLSGGTEGRAFIDKKGEEWSVSFSSNMSADECRECTEKLFTGGLNGFAQALSEVGEVEWEITTTDYKTSGKVWEFPLFNLTLKFGRSTTVEDTTSQSNGVGSVEELLAEMQELLSRRSKEKEAA